MGRVEAPKFQPELVQVTKPDERELLRRIWEDKRGREILSVPPKFALYITLPRPRLDPVGLGRMLLREMESNPREAYIWSRQWGMTVVGFHPAKQEFGVQLLSTSSAERHPYVPVETNIQFSPSEFFESISLGEGRHRIDLNDTMTTIEGIGISLTHLLEWAIWERYWSSKKREGAGEFDETLFAQAISAIKKEGVVIRPASQGEILARYLNSDRQEGTYTVRLYGSRACPAVPFVIGGVLINPGERSEEIKTGSQPLILTPVRYSCLTPESPSMAKKEVSFDVVERPLIVCGATLGKRLHAGHLLTLGTAHILQAALGGEEIYFISNNTGPRVAKTITAYAQETGMSIEEAASLWRRGEIRPWEIERSYRSRGVADESYQRVMRFLPEDDYLISMTNWLQGVLSRIGFSHTSVVTESTFSNKWNLFCSQVDPEWAGSGFAFARLGKRGLGGIPLQNGGEYSIVAKFVVAFNELCQLLGKDGVVIVDNTIDASYMVHVAQKYLGIGAEQIAGGAVGFGLRMASGTGGEAPSIDRLFKSFKDRVETTVEEAGEEVLGTEFRNTIVHFINTRWALAPRVAGRQTNSHYEFAKPDSLVQSLVRCLGESRDLREKVKSKIGKLIGCNRNKEKLGGDAAKDQRILRLVQDIERISPTRIIRAMNTYKRWKPEAHNLHDLATILEETGHSLPDQVEIASRVVEGKLVLIRRISPYFQTLINLMETLDEETIKSLSPDLAERAAHGLEKAFLKAGYTF